MLAYFVFQACLSVQALSAKSILPTNRWMSRVSFVIGSLAQCKVAICKNIMSVTPDSCTLKCCKVSWQFFRKELENISGQAQKLVSKCFNSNMRQRFKDKCNTSINFECKQLEGPAKKKQEKVSWNTVAHNDSGRLSRWPDSTGDCYQA